MLCKVDGGQFQKYTGFLGNQSEITELMMPDLGSFAANQTYIREYQKVDWSELTALRKITVANNSRLIGLNLRTAILSLEEIDFQSVTLEVDALENLLEHAPNLESVKLERCEYLMLKRANTGKPAILDQRIREINLGISSAQTTPDSLIRGSAWDQVSETDSQSDDDEYQQSKEAGGPLDTWRGRLNSFGSNSSIPGVREFAHRYGSVDSDAGSDFTSSSAESDDEQLGILFQEDQSSSSSAIDDTNEYDDEDEEFEETSSQGTEIEVGIGPTPMERVRSAYTAARRAYQHGVERSYDASSLSDNDSELDSDHEHGSAERSESAKGETLKGGGSLRQFTMKRSLEGDFSTRELIKGVDLAPKSPVAEKIPSGIRQRSDADPSSNRNSQLRERSRSELFINLAEYLNPGVAASQKLKWQSAPPPLPFGDSYVGSELSRSLSSKSPVLKSATDRSQRGSDQHGSALRSETKRHSGTGAGARAGVHTTQNLETSRSTGSHMRAEYHLLRSDFDIQAEGRVEERRVATIVDEIRKVLVDNLKPKDRSHFFINSDLDESKVTLLHKSIPVLEARSESVKVFKGLRNNVTELSLCQKALVVLGSLGIPPCPIEGIHVDTKGKDNKLADEINAQFDSLYLEEHEVNNPHSPQAVELTVSLRAKK